MTATEEPTLYDVLEVDPASSLDELRAAVERARETFGTESLAVYALVDEDQLGELRARLDEAAEVLLDPARRATYDRSIGRIGPATLWAEDDDEDGPPLPPVEAGPHARAASLEVDDEDEADDDEDGIDGDAEEDAAPRQHALALEVTEAPGPFGRAPEKPPVAHREALISGDWAAAVPGELASRPATDPVPPPARDHEPAKEDVAEPVAAAAEEPAPERTGLPTSLGLRVKAAPPPPPPAPEPVVPEAIVEPPPAPVATMPAERVPEHPSRPRDRQRLEIPSDAEFNGELLRLVRESYGLSLQQVAERTRITRIHLENVEADRYDKLPATVYLRGILVNLARELRLDPARVSKTYLLAAQRGHARGS
ncbi:MAG TPA: helix-turn-helix transcriptional regulator [Myxococcaceae bacterium]|nr:helix-turn-helix transcriptional regulator [Myxococcaceae bacterium]